MLEYKDQNDFELLYLICEQSEEANEMLFKKYKPIVELKAKKYLKFAQNKGLDYNDLIQEGMIGLSEAVRDFKVQKDVKFSTFANLCIERQINTAITMANRKKHKLLNESLSLDESINDGDRPLIESILNDKDSDPFNYLADLETKKELYENIIETLTPFEQQVFDLKLKHFDYKEIALKLQKSYKSIDSAIQRIRLKLKKIVKKDK